jgi:predicted RNA-binding protein
MVEADMTECNIHITGNKFAVGDCVIVEIKENGINFRLVVETTKN